MYRAICLHFAADYPSYSLRQTISLWEWLLARFFSRVLESWMVESSILLYMLA
jgi:hypothetical protein